MAAKKKTLREKPVEKKAAAVARASRKSAAKTIIPVLRSVAPLEAAAAMPVPVPAPAPIARTAAIIPHDQIARRAYDIWETKLRIAADSLRNWTEAEAAIRAELQNE